MAIRFTVNGSAVEFAGDSAMPLLWYLRDHAGLTGAKYGCGIGACGACTVHVEGRAQRACIIPVAAIAGKEIITIEGGTDQVIQAVQSAWTSVPQCGWCQTGQIMAAADLLRRIRSPSDDEIDSISNLCRCGTYPWIRAAIRRASETLARQRT